LDAIADKALREEFERNFILQATRERALSVKELARELEVPPYEILEQVVALRSKNLIAMEPIVGITPRYKAIVAGGG
ncbi:MAG TPA: hypothetical protein VLU38_06960, partial [Methanomassiliicoccales archaeon]|nr:hypothetical protein [Methanomassiliicoccales archaeon]